MTTYLAYDSAESLHIPPGAWCVLGYSDGRYQWSPSDWALFPRAYRIPITVLGEHAGARIVDCEPGAVWPPAKAQQWLDDEAGAGRPGTLYGDAEVHATLTGVGFWRILAKWDGVSVIPPGYVGKQYQSTPAYDLTVVDPLWVATVAAGGPPGALQAPASLVVAVGATPGAPDGFTTDLASLKGTQLPPSTVLTLTINGAPVTTDVGTLTDAGLL